MISRYALYDTISLETRFGIDTGLPKGVKPRYNISPTMDEPVIVNRDGKKEIALMMWGLVANGSKDTNSVFRYKTFNVPAEKILSKHSWELAVRHSRCLVPANGFYLLSDDKSEPRRAYYVRSKDASILGLAGVHSTWQDNKGVTHETYSIITTEAGHDTRDFTERLPVVIRQDEEALWLDPSVTDANSLYGMFRSYSSDQLDMIQVDEKIYSTKLETSDLIEPYTA